MLENPSTVQLDHRILATATFVSILSLWAYTRFNPRIRGAVPNSARRGMLGVVHLVFVQVALGISTLVYLVPVPLAAAHQAGSLALLSGVLVLGNRVWIPKRGMRLVQQKLKQVNNMAAGVGSRQRMLGLGKEAVRADVKAMKRNLSPSASS